MTTIDGTPTVAQFLIMKVASRAKRREAIQATRAHAVPAVAFVRLVLHLAGFSCLTYAAFMWDMIAGFCVAGICCFVLSTLLTGRSAEPIDNRR